MARLKPFRALRYNPHVAGALDTLIAPPYDVISPALRRRLAARSPNNFVHVDLPEESPGRDVYRDAAALYQKWRRDGILALDTQPTLTHYSQQFALPSGGKLTRSGFFGRLGLDFGGPMNILPHERTFEAHVDDRIRLSRACHAHLSPVFVLYQDREREAERALESAAAADSMETLTAYDDEATHHALTVIRDRAAIETAQRIIARGPVVIADGHHRTRAAQSLALEAGSGAPPPPDHPMAFLLAVFVRVEDPGLLVLPTHRLVRPGGDSWEKLLASLAGSFESSPVEKSSGDSHASLASAVRDLRSAAGEFVLARRGEARIFRPRPGVDPYGALGVTASLTGADTALIDECLIGNRLAIDVSAAARTGSVKYVRDVEAGVAALQRGEADLAFFMAATPVEVVFRAVREGALFPRKSTFFHPKIASGLVIDPHED